jgi:hypothetical protein
MRVPLEPGDEIVSIVRVEAHFLIVTKHGYFFEVWYEGMGCYHIKVI